MGGRGPTMMGHPPPVRGERQLIEQTIIGKTKGFDGQGWTWYKGNLGLVDSGEKKR